MIKQLSHTGTQVRVVVRVDDALARHRDDAGLFHLIIGQDDAARNVRMQARLGKAVEHGRMLHSGLAGDIVFALPVKLDEIALDQRELAGLDLDQEDVAARRQDDEVDLPMPALTLMCGLPGDAVEDLVTAWQRLLETVQNIKLAVFCVVSIGLSQVS